MIFKRSILECHVTSFSEKYNEKNSLPPNSQMAVIEQLGQMNESPMCGVRRKSGQWKLSII